MTNFKFRKIKGLNSLAAYSHTENKIKIFVAVCAEANKQVFGKSIDEAFNNLENEL